MKPRNKQHLIISLITDDLRNARLVYGLQSIGLQSDDHLLNLGQTIFKLMDFPDTLESDPIFDHYYKLSRKATKIHLEDTAKLLQLAKEIYHELKRQRRNINTGNKSG